MRYLFTLGIVLLSVVGYSQTVGQFRYDSTKFLKVGGYNEVIIQNNTKDSTGGLFTNVGNGWGRWIKPRTISGGIIIGLDTFYISGGTGNDSAYVNSYVDTSINALILIRDNGGEDTIYYVGGGGSGGLDSTLYVKYTDTAAMLSPYLPIVDTTNKWFANASKINDTTYRFYKGSGYFDVIVPISGGGGTPDTVYAKFPIQVDTSGVKDSIGFKLPPESVPVNLHPTDTLDAQFMKVRRQLLTTLSDTVRWNTTGTAPSGTPELYYRWSQAGALVNLQIWAYYPTNGTSVTGAAITLPSDCPVPNYPAGWLAGDLIIAQGTGGIYVNRTRTFSELSTSSSECVLKRDNGNTRWELQNKSGNVSARYAMWNIVYETSDY